MAVARRCVRPRSLFLSSLRVAVIDSGVYPAHPHISGIAGGVSVSAACEVTEGDYLDRLGHGTAVMAAIQEKAGDGAEYFAVRVFHEALRTNARCLARALEWAIDEGMNFINLSLGTRNPQHAGLFAPLISRAVADGLSFVSAHDVEGELQYPGCMEGVRGVGLDREFPRDAYRFTGGVYFASGYPRPAPGIPVERNLQGISFAVANVTGLLVRERLNSYNG